MSGTQKRWLTVQSKEGCSALGDQFKVAGSTCNQQMKPVQISRDTGVLRK
jgi:hypothetical protein